MAETSIKGYDQLMKNLNGIVGKELLKIFEAGTRGSAAIIAREARRLCPVGRGQNTQNTRVKSKKTTIHLRDTIKVKKMRLMGGKVRYYIHAGQGLRYAHLVEFGTSAHRINVRKGIVGAATSLAIGLGFVASANHPGSKATPFMRPALDTQYQKAVDAFAKSATKQIDRLRLKL